jgi:hypothetical protein
MEGKVIEYKTIWGNGVGIITGPHEQPGLWNIITKGGEGNVKESSIIRIFKDQEVALAVHEMFIS